MSEFSGTPFVMGSLVGLRHAIPSRDDEGPHLRGPHAGYRYRKGENVATCDVALRDWTRRKREHDSREQALATGETETRYRPGRMPGVLVTRSELVKFNQAAHDDKLDLGLQLLSRNFVQHFARMSGNEDLIAVREPLVPYIPRPFPEPPPEPDHKVGGLACTCGFYAYFETEGSLQFRRGGNMGSIVEGYGTTVVGSRGFRCEKLRYLALIASAEAVTGKQEMTMDEFAWVVRAHAEQQEIARYYGVPLFDSLDQALAEFPLTRPEDA